LIGPSPLNLQINGKGPINNSFLTAPIAGGIAEGSVLSLTLADPDGGAFNSETSPLLLQPYDLDIQCDTINLNLLGWINMLPDQSRFFLACVGL